MRTTFHLDLDHTGIRLRRGSGKGQSILGEVALDDPHFETRVEDLRREAMANTDGPLLTDITIPQSEVLYTTVDLPEDAKDDAARKAAIEAELDGMTPYAMDDLVYDWKLKGKSEAAVAAVARETLDQAEDFAVANGFNPQRFTAEPRKGLFSAGPDFGQTTFAASGSAPVAPPPEAPVTRIADLSFDEIDHPADMTPLAVPATPESPPESESTLAEPVEEKSETQEASAPSDASEAETAEATTDADKASERDGAPAKVDDPNDKPAASGKPLRAAGTKSKAPVPAAKESSEKSSPDDALEGTGEVALAAQPDTTTDERPAPKTPSAPSFSTSRPAAATGAAAGNSALGSIASRIAMMPDGGAGPSADAKSSPRPARAAPVPPRPNGAAAPARRNSPTPTVRKVAPPPSSASAASLTPGTASPAIHPSTPMDGDVERSEAERMTVFGERNAGGAGLSLVPLLVGIAVALALAVGIWAAYLLLSPSRNALLQPGGGTEAVVEDGIGAIEPADVAPSEDLAPELASPVGSASSEDAPQTAALDDTAAPEAPSEDSAPSLPDAADTAQSDDQMAALSQPDQTAAPDTAPDPLQAAAPDSAATEGEGASENVAAPDTTPSPEDPLQRPADADETSRYAATGVEAAPPASPGAPGADRIEDLFLSRSDNPLRAQDRVAALSLPQDTGPAAPDALMPPPAPDARFELDEDGLVVATPEGAVSPQGVLVTAGAPPAVPPEAPDRPAAAPEPPSEDDLVIPVNAGEPALRPRTRPGDAGQRDDAALEADADPSPAEGAETLVTRLAGLSPMPRPARPGDARDEEEQAEEPLAPLPAVLVNSAPDITPEARPASLTAELTQADTEAGTATGSAAASAAAAALAGLATALEEPISPYAVAASQRPANRPSGLAARVARAREEPVRVAQASAVATPSAPTRGSVASRATVANAINLRRVNLVGVYGTQSNRRALVRLPSGRFVKVKVGDRVDGGRVRAIGDSRLSYVKGGRQIVLEMPRG
ncbi:hypothetical protein [Palleronia pelagia]|uniref:Type IV pilus biogenesis protein PilP n=1 Tax=Palleronia pelagia TaxID=387096 RepID=A0A1H8KUK9_9RHOB|nr:hypothetical protein [Palleronia pelagia]SEN96584.1 hypothetical protein SAMN04488011_108156 [Palleronia pelagia]